MFKAGASNEAGRARAEGLGSILTSGIAAAGTYMDKKDANAAKLQTAKETKASSLEKDA